MSDEKKQNWEIESLGKLSLEEMKNFIGYKEADHASLKGKNLARAYTLDNRVQGDYLVGILSEEGIPAINHSNRDTAFDGIYVGSHGAGYIITAEEDASRARTIIESVVETIRREQELSLDDEDGHEDDF